MSDFKSANLSKTFKLLSIIFSLFVISSCARITLEEQFLGMQVCKVENVYLDTVTKKPSGKYFVERKLNPCRVDEAAFYCVDDTFYGLVVTQIAIPYRGPFNVHAIYLKDRPDVVKAVLSSRFKNLNATNTGVSPVLIANPSDQGGSVFYCDVYSE
ncbi:hypothetical protein K3169_09715 [Pseudomonas phytophila]|uniref:Lipoprotein n=1 Tax=Pseudomonas phytophila TaxID=2867264 RepID=A0ABY6FJM1_9PSED|nr:hypothetical protein [Pseudomonas phytophila]UXZ98119.1 hypothetical protein K3169_09715 [Pseudomonas phytophila]